MKAIRGATGARINPCEIGQYKRGGTKKAVKVLRIIASAAVHVLLSQCPDMSFDQPKTQCNAYAQQLV